MIRFGVGVRASPRIPNPFDPLMTLNNFEQKQLPRKNEKRNILKTGTCVALMKISSRSPKLLSAQSIYALTLTHTDTHVCAVNFNDCLFKIINVKYAVLLLFWIRSLFFSPTFNRLNTQNAVNNRPKKKKNSCKKINVCIEVRCEWPVSVSRQQHRHLILIRIIIREPHASPDTSHSHSRKQQSAVPRPVGPRRLH